MWNFYTVLLQIHSGNCLQKIGLLDLSLIKLLQNEQGRNFFALQCSFTYTFLCIAFWIFPQTWPAVLKIHSNHPAYRL